jgi:NADP-dependent 3-hydroxy acid dehydrogenase YdfG
MSKTIFITGATSGIGKACAEKFAAANYRLIISGRREDRLKKLKSDLESTYNVEVIDLCFDVQDKNAVFEAIKNLPANWKSKEILESMNHHLENKYMHHHHFKRHKY